MHRGLLALAPLLLTGCFNQSTWIPTIWGGDVLEEALIDDGSCTVTLDAFVVSIRQGALITSDGTASAVLPGGQLFDLVPPGPQSMGAIDLRKGIYPETVYFLGPAVEPGPDSLVGRGKLIGLDNAASDLNPILGNASAEQRDVMIAAEATWLVEGAIACPTKAEMVSRAVRWAIDDVPGSLRCADPDLELVGGSFGDSVLHVAGEAAFAAPRALFDAGADDAITLEQLGDAGLVEPLRQQLRDAFSTAEPCVWEEVDAL